MHPQTPYLREWKKNNPEKVKKYSHTYNQKHADTILSYNRKRKRGILLSPDEATAQFIKQGCKCGMPLCGATEPGGVGTWHADHNPITHKFRSLLCARCNLHLGIYEKHKSKFESYLENNG